MVLDPGSTVAGVLTRSKTASAPVDWCRAQLPRGRARAIIVNSGNANAFTGKTGETSVRRVVEAVAAGLGCRRQDVLAARSEERRVGKSVLVRVNLGCRRLF